MSDRRAAAEKVKAVGVAAGEYTAAVDAEWLATSDAVSPITRHAIDLQLALDAKGERLGRAVIIIRHLLDSDMPVEDEEWDEQRRARAAAVAFLKEKP